MAAADDLPRYVGQPLGDPAKEEERGVCLVASEQSQEAPGSARIPHTTLQPVTP